MYCAGVAKQLSFRTGDQTLDRMGFGRQDSVSMATVKRQPTVLMYMLVQNGAGQSPSKLAVLLAKHVPNLFSLWDTQVHIIMPVIT